MTSREERRRLLDEVREDLRRAMDRAEETFRARRHAERAPRASGRPEVGVFGAHAGPLVRLLSWTGGRSFYRISHPRGVEVRVRELPPALGGGWRVGAVPHGAPDAVLPPREIACGEAEHLDLAIETAARAA